MTNEALYLTLKQELDRHQRHIGLLKDILDNPIHSFETGSFADKSNDIIKRIALSNTLYTVELNTIENEFKL